MFAAPSGIYTYRDFVAWCQAGFAAWRIFLVPLAEKFCVLDLMVLWLVRWVKTSYCSVRR